MTVEIQALSSESLLEEIRCSLCIVSGDIGPDELTAMVGVAPTTTQRRGEPRSSGAPGRTVAVNQWVWRPPGEVKALLNAQLDAIWSALGSRADAFRELPTGAHVVLDIAIYHRGDQLRLGWTLAQRHVAMTAAFNASMSVDEYDYTER